MSSTFSKAVGRICPVLVAYALTTTTVFAQAMPVFCNGTGRMVTTDVTGTARGRTMTIAGSASNDLVTVEVADCGRSIIVAVPGQGHTIRLVQSALDARQFTDTVMIQGYASDFTMVQQDHLSLSGTYSVNTPDAVLGAGVTIALSETRAPRLDGCFDDPEPEFRSRGTSLTHAALADALIASGRTLPAGYDSADFIATETDAHGGLQAVYVLLAANGDIIPLERPKPPASICEPDDAEPALEPTHLLRFKVYSFERTTTAFVQRVEIFGERTVGHIVEQHEAAATGENQSSVKTAMLLAMSALSSKPNDFVAPVRP